MGAEQIVMLILSGLAGYFLGCVSFAYLIGMLAFKRDVRKYGSGNAGATNMVRSFGWQYGMLTFLGDAGKGALGCLVGLLLAGSLGSYIAAIFVIIGHTYPIFMKFRGGKGISAAAGVSMFLAPGYSSIVFLIAAALMAITRMISVGSIVGVILIAAGSFMFYPDNIYYQITTCIIAALCIFAHRENIKRIFNGTEKKFRFTKSSEALSRNEELNNAANTKKQL